MEQEPWSPAPGPDPLLLLLGQAPLPPKASAASSGNGVVRTQPEQMWDEHLLLLGSSLWPLGSIRKAGDLGEAFKSVKKRKLRTREV